jgi:DNA-binding transcriptional LysR family regulator
VADLDLPEFRSFLAVAEERDVARAATRLHLPHQTVSGQLRQLERALGVTLFVRTSRGVLLTAAGAALAANGTPVPDVADAADELVERVRAAARDQTGRLRLVCMPRATAEFAAEVVKVMETAVPGIRLDLVTVSTLPEEIDLLRSGEVDAGILWLPVGVPGLRYAEVRADRRVLAVPPGHRLAGRPSVTLADLAGEPVVGPDIAVSDDAREHGIWLAPEPLSRYFPAPHRVWLPVEDALPSRLAVVWPAKAPEPLVSRLIAEVRSVTGWTSDQSERRTVDA